jgi:hypothetical protein
MFEREHELNDRYVNMTNHVYSHRCSDYCWKPQMIEVEYDETDPEHAQDHPGVRPTYDRRDGSRVVKLVCCECRMGFGYRAGLGSEVIEIEPVVPRE